MAAERKSHFALNAPDGQTDGRFKSKGCLAQLIREMEGVRVVMFKKWHMPKLKQLYPKYSIL